MQDHLIPSEGNGIDPKMKNGPLGSPGIQIFLVSKNRGRKLIRTLARDHEDVLQRSGRAVGWLLDPRGGRLVVIISYAQTTLDRTGRHHSVYIPIGSDLNSGFSKRSH